MNDDRYNEPALKAYLLGAAAEDETERFDELSVADGDFFAALRAAESDLVDAYVNEELDVTERRQFETHFLATPKHREKLKFAEGLNRFAQKNQADPAVSFTTVEGTPDGGLLSSIRSLFTIRFAVAAAALLILAVGSWIVLRNTSVESDNVARHTDENRTVAVDNSNTPKAVDTPVEPRLPERQPEPPNINTASNSGNRQSNASERIRPEPRSVVALVLPPPLRGASAKSVAVPEGTSQLSVRLELESDEFNSFRVVLRDESTKAEPWRSGAIKTSGKSDRKALSLGIPAKWLKPGVYSLNVSGVSPDGSEEIIGDYLFRVVR